MRRCLSREAAHSGPRMNRGMTVLACLLAGWLAFPATPAVHAAETPVAALTNSAPVPFLLQRGKIVVPARLNDSEPLSFWLDTGFGITTVHPDAVERLGLRRAGKVTIVGIAGEEEAPTYAGARFHIGGATYTPRRVAALPSERERSRRKDGILGASLFRRYVVELDFRVRQLRLHEPAGFAAAAEAEALPLRFRSDTPILTASLRTPAGTNVSAEFEIDSGCDSGVCLGREFVERHGLLESSEGESAVKSGVGGTTRTHSSHVRQLRLGRFTLPTAQADFFLDGSPADPPLAGHIGLGVLCEFRVTFDYSRKRVILEK